MSTIKKKEINNIIKNSGLHAEFRLDKENIWNEVVNRGKNTSFIYMKHFVDYNTAYFQSLSETLIDISLILYNDYKPCAVWPLVFDENEKEPIKTIDNSYGGVVLPPLFVDPFPKKSQRRIIKSCLKFLNSLLDNCHGQCWRTNELSTEGSMGQWHQIILENGGKLDKINYELYVDLSMSIEEIRSCIRKSFRPLVSSGMRDWRVLVMDKYDKHTWDEFRELHIKVAGRVTRSIETWNIQREAIKSGNAFLIYVTDSKGVMAGGGYFDMSDYECNYSVGTYDKDFSDQPLGHMIQYQAIMTAKEKGRKMYYIGERFYQEELPHIPKKRVQISHFKQGFSTNIFPRIGLFNHSKVVDRQK